MFCPSCGIEDTIGLPYCNRCGANLGGMTAPQTEPPVINLTKPTLIIGVTLAMLTLGGFAGLIEGAKALAPIVRNSDPLIAMIVFGMLTIMIVDIVLVRQLSKLISASLSPKQPQQGRQAGAFSGPPTSQLPRPTTARLEPAPSVTEHTTRFLEPVYRSPAEARDPATREKLEE
ncbi:MAG TPA: hypothetical protein VHE60_06920 [Pyrinomonadaceae bacterium]|nr:hypothetical protein [Pyrinomonadaceae bacterium]